VTTNQTSIFDAPPHRKKSEYGLRNESGFNTSGLFATSYDLREGTPFKMQTCRMNFQSGEMVEIKVNSVVVVVVVVVL
jgi:hypothetical protein